MRSSRHIPLVTYVRRTLVARLAFMATCIALAMAVLAYMAEERALEKEVVIEAQLGLEALVERTREIIAAEGLQTTEAFRRAVAEAVASKRKDRRGQTVYARFSRPGTEDSVEFLDRTFVLHDAVEAFVRKEKQNRTEEPAIRSGTVIIAEVPSVLAMLPFGESASKKPALAELIFIPAPSVLAAMNRKALLTAGIAVLITLATTALLYPVVLRLTNRLVAFSRNMQAANFETLSLLGCVVAKRDSDTDDHNYRVTLYALRMGEDLGLEPSQMRALAMGAFLHDVGKIAIRDDILLKPGKLTPEEFDIMKTHVRHGLDVIDRSTWLRDARDVVGGHHEKFDGSGYPTGLEGTEIPLSARIFAVADVFDALTSRRPYKEPLSCGEALNILTTCRGRHFDPDVVNCFAAMATKVHERYAHKTGSDLKAELIDMSWRYFQADAEVLV